MDNQNKPQDRLYPVSTTPRTNAERQPRLRPKSPRVTVLSVGLSAEDQVKLKELQRLLSGNGPDDSPSLSLVVRRSVEQYLTKLLGIAKSDPKAIQSERLSLAANARRINRGRPVETGPAKI